MDGWMDVAIHSHSWSLTPLSGFTPQYTGLEELYKTYHDRGLEVLGFPSNEFGGQEPGSDEDIASFCTVCAMSFMTQANTDIDIVAS
jgi:glutathione peroxidase-family protein